MKTYYILAQDEGPLTITDLLPDDLHETVEAAQQELNEELALGTLLTGVKIFKVTVSEIGEE